ncbi:DUF2066 domain-containing protein [Ferrovibrio sp.]|uniref:DUF2066 domain-containing protein n=1 Tax=Ferrovibrio sp. TaxID=1917215 RepID=UPI0025C478B8|nr:DUF2066 domain-containing protein [Ferrovibrio sp.]MBX3455283.1 DUF2066 domain-containing protein [Ferrovibrio sp.]
MIGVSAVMPVAYAQQPAARPEIRQLPVFTVAGVPVDASADSAANARPVALQEGQRRAFTQLLRRLTIYADHGRLPQPTEALLNEAVAGFEIDEERTSATRYLGRITVRFRPEAIRNLLQAEKLTYSEVRAKPVLLIPVWQGSSASGQGAVLWSGENPWRESWKRRADIQALVPLLLPEDSAANPLPPLDRLLGETGRLRSFIEAQNAGEALLIAATLVSQDDGNVRIEIYPSQSGPAWDANTAALEKLEPFIAVGRDVESTLNGAVDGLVLRFDNHWKGITRLDFDHPSSLSAAASFANLAEWVKLREQLAAVAPIRRFDVLRMSHRDAQLQIDFFGAAEQLIPAMAQRGLDMRQRDGFWELGLRKP